MFRREKTEFRQKISALAGVIALVTAVSLGNWGSVISPPKAGPALVPDAQSLLSGMLISQGCARLADGSLSLLFDPGSASPASCCVMQDSPKAVKAPAGFSASVMAEKMVDGFLIVAETDDRQSVVLHRGTLYGAENAISTTSQAGVEQGRGIAKICFSVKGPGVVQTIRIMSAQLIPVGK